MRPTPPFDPRVQPVGMYVGAPAQMYMQPMMHNPTQPPTNFTPIPHIPSSYPPEYMMNAGHYQQQPQYNDKQIKLPKP